MIMTISNIRRLARYTEAALLIALMGAIGASYATVHIATTSLLGKVAVMGAVGLAAMWITLGFIVLEVFARRSASVVADLPVPDEHAWLTWYREMIQALMFITLMFSGALLIIVLMTVYMPGWTLLRDSLGGLWFLISHYIIYRQ
jgi:hypothetical protein